jgi:hypothetical protein
VSGQRQHLRPRPQWRPDLGHERDDGGWSTVEYQSGLTTSSYSVFPYNPGGLFSAAGQTKQVLVDPNVGYRTEAVDPLTCGHKYQAVTDDPTDGYVYSNVLSEPACS